MARLLLDRDLLESLVFTKLWHISTRRGRSRLHRQTQAVSNCSRRREAISSLAARLRGAETCDANQAGLGVERGADVGKFLEALKALHVGVGGRRPLKNRGDRPPATAEALLHLPKLLRRDAHQSHSANGRPIAKAENRLRRSRPVSMQLIWSECLGSGPGVYRAGSATFTPLVR